MKRKSIYLAMLVALGLAAVPPMTHAQVTNLVSNPSFEEDEAILNDAAYEYWWTWGWDTGLTSTARIDDKEAVDGIRSLRIEPKGGTDWYFIVAYSSIPMKVGTKYTASFWMKAEAPRAVSAQYKDSNNNPDQAYGNVNFQVTTEWAEYHLTLAAQTGQTKVEFLCAAVDTPFWLDFAMVYEGDYVAGMVPGGAAGRPKAFYPDPKDGAVIDTKTVTLGWKAGDFAVSHKVYISDSLEAVTAGQVQPIDTTTPSLEVGKAAPYATGLTFGKVYYWRVDEVNNADPESPWKGDIWSFRVRPQIAWNPTPGDGLKYVGPDQDLAWEPGLGAIFHMVYFGESRETVSTAAVADWMGTAATYDPGTLKTGTTYYWRVDERTPAVKKGDVWSFTTVPDIAVTNPDLLGWWTLDEGMGTTAVDWSGHGNHGVINGGAKWTHGVQGGALQLDGTDDYVEIPEVGISGAAARTISGWVKANSTAIASWTDVFGFSGPSGNGGHFDIERRDYSSYALHVYGWERDLIPVDLEWHHFAATYDGANAVRYADGVSVGSETVTLNTTGTFRMGKRVDTGGCFPGIVDDIRLYSKVLSEAEIKAVMRGDVSLAWKPAPAPDAILDIRNVDSLSWSAGDAAASHDVYFGSDRNAVADANHSSPAYRGNQATTSFSLASLVDVGAGDCFWRIDEVEAGGTVHKGNVWQFTVLPYLLVDDFESYTNDSPKRLFQAWVDGSGFSADEFFPKGNAGNGSGALVGYDPQAGNIAETRLVHGGSQSMPLAYDNTGAVKYSEAERTFSPAQNWTVAGVKTLVIYFRGATGNTGQLYAKINGTKVLYTGAATDIAGTKWVAWNIDLASSGASLTSVTTLAIGIDGGGKGTVYIDDIRLIKP